MNGAESLVHTLLQCGVDTCFTNPGTSEMHFVAALDRIPGMRCVLGLQENVVTGAADGYARMTGRPAATLLHCGPGLANGLANLHNARRARTPIVNLVGDQATRHRPLDAPLTADTEGWARPVSLWTRTARTATTVGGDAAACVQAAVGGIATLILPSDTCWDDGGAVAERLPAVVPASVSPDAVEGAARLLRSEGKTMLIIGGSALRADSLALAQGIVAATGAGMLAPTSNARIERGAGRAAIERVPYPVDMATAALAGVRNLILVGAREPVGFFAYPGKPGRMYPEDCVVHVLARPEQDGGTALARLAEALGTKPSSGAAARGVGEPARGAVGPDQFAQSVAAPVAGACDRGRRERELRAEHLFGVRRGGAARLAAAYRRGDRRRDPDGDRRRGGRAGPPGGVAAGGWLGDVHAAGLMDAGARAAGRDHRDPGEPEVSDPARRIPQRGR